jgi:hypothetical protein
VVQRVPYSLSERERERQRQRERLQTSDWRQSGGRAPACIAGPRLRLPSQQIATSNADFLRASSCLSLHSDFVRSRTTGTEPRLHIRASIPGKCTVLYICTVSKAHTSSHPIVTGKYFSVTEQTDREASHSLMLTFRIWVLKGS